MKSLETKQFETKRAKRKWIGHNISITLWIHFDSSAAQHNAVVVFSSSASRRSY
jgi:hypothetical protein